MIHYDHWTDLSMIGSRLLQAGTHRDCGHKELRRRRAGRHESGSSHLRIENITKAMSARPAESIPSGVGVAVQRLTSGGSFIFSMMMSSAATKKSSHTCRGKNKCHDDVTLSYM